MDSARRKGIVITETPPLHVSNLFDRKIKEGLFRQFYGKEATLFYFGRGALWHAISAMRLSASDNVLVPAYHCGVEIEAVAMAGGQLRYYDIRDDLSIDVSELRGRIDSGTRAIVLIHYFGFPQPVEAISELCKAGTIMLIEDCSQGLFSSCQGQPLGTFGDAAVFSQRKTLPIPDGGALLVNNPELMSASPIKRPSAYVGTKKILGMLIRSLFNWNPRDELPAPLERLATVANRLVARSAGIRYSSGMEIDMDRCCLAMSGVSEQIMNRTRVRYVIQRRRDNYSHLLSRLTETPCIRIVRKQLPEGVCPLFFPVRVERICRHDLQERLLRSGINSFVFGEQLHPSLPGNQHWNAEELSRGILCLPVHQGLNSEHMTAIAESLLQAARELDNADTH